MKCLVDIKYDIIDKIGKDLTEQGPFRYGGTRDELVLTGTEEEGQAFVQKYNNLFGEDLATLKDGVVTIEPSDELGEKYLSEYKEANRIDRESGETTQFSDEEAERSFNISNTGENTSRFLDLAPAEKESGVFEKYLSYKQRLVATLHDRVGQINRDLKRNLTNEERTKLYDLKNQINTRLNGDIHRGIEGLNQEIDRLQKEDNINAVGHYAEADLKRLAVVSQSDNLSDLKEAQNIVDFYEAAGLFQTDKENPFFSPQEIFFTDASGNLTPDFKLGEATIAQFKDWSNRAIAYKSMIDLKYKDATTKTVNSSRGVQAIHGERQFSFNEIVHSETGLKDIDWVSAWALDITQSIGGGSSMLGQVMHLNLTNAVEDHSGWSREYAHKMDQLQPKVAKRLGELFGGKYKLKAFGIIGVNGVSYDLFLDKTKEGLDTGRLITRYSNEFTDAQRAQDAKFQQGFRDARIANDAAKAGMFNRAFENNRIWKRAHTIMMDIRKIAEIQNDPDYAQFHDASTTEDQIKAHKAELVKVLGERGYQEQVDVQRQLLNKYISERQSYINAQLQFESKDTEDELSPGSKFTIQQWENQNDPLVGVEDYHSVDGAYRNERRVNSFMRYNNTIPRQSQVAVSNDGVNYTFSDTGVPTGYYNENYKSIEEDDTLREFYDHLKEGLDKIRENMPYDLQTKMAANTLPMLMKSTGEILLDDRNNVLSMVSSAWRHMMERMRLAFGLVKQSEISYATVDPITGKTNYKINDQFMQGNSRAISERIAIEKAKFKAAQGVDKVGRYTVMALSSLKPNALAHIAQMLNIDIPAADISSGRIDAIKRVIGEKVEVGKIIRDFAIHSAVQAQSFDMPKLMKYFTHLSSMYAARQSVLPIMELMKQHYESIQAPKTNNVGNPVRSFFTRRMVAQGPRERAIQQERDWFERVMLDNYGIKHWGVFGKATTEKIEEGEVKTHIPWLGKQIYSTEEKKKIKEIDKLLSSPKMSDKDKQALRTIKQGFGKTRTASAAIVNFLSMIRTIGLGWNITSAMSNFMEGYVSNMVQAASGQYYNPNEIYYAYHVARQSWLKNLTFGMGATPDARLCRLLMDRYNVLMEHKNELQKSSTKSNLSALESLNPHELNSRVEYLNQSVVMISMLRSQKIKDKDGNESSIWDAFDKKTGKLKSEFRSDDNVNNWEHLRGEDYKTFAAKLNEATVRAHGNYDVMRGMMAKSNLLGKAILMFKTWLPTQLYLRFANEQENIRTGANVKGTYRSLTGATGAVMGLGVGAVLLGPVGMAVAAGLGYAGGKIFGVQTELGAVKELIGTTTALFKKALGMPVNMIAGRALIDSSKDFEKWVGFGKFTALDAKNMRANMAELAVTLTTLALVMMVKSFFWNDDDGKDDPERQFHNFAVNKLMQLATQCTMYVNPNDMYNSTVGSIGPLRFLTNCGKEVSKMESFLEGYDPGAAGLMQQTSKTFLPGMFRDGLPGQGGSLGLGFNSLTSKQFTPTPYDNWFHSEAWKEKKASTQERKQRRAELESMGYTNSRQITRILNVELPTPQQLNRKGVTMEEWQQMNQDYQLPDIDTRTKKEIEAEKVGQ